MRLMRGEIRRRMRIGRGESPFAGGGRAQCGEGKALMCVF